ncbi:MAG: hypothetical protein R2864_13750 [Syntrophotaleaceae bacterium]
MVRNSWQTIVLIGLLLCWPFSVLAAFDLEPRLLVREEYDDNIYLDDARKESDFITTAAPGIKLLYEAKTFKANLDYSLHFLKYLNNSEEDENSLRDIQRVHLQGIVFPEQDFSVKIFNDYDRVTVDERLQSSENNSRVNKTNLNRISINPEYEFKKFNIFKPRIGYVYEKLSYDAREGDDSDSHAFT